VKSWGIGRFVWADLSMYLLDEIVNVNEDIPIQQKKMDMLMFNVFTDGSAQQEFLKIQCFQLSQ